MYKFYFFIPWNFFHYFYIFSVISIVTSLLTFVNQATTFFYTLGDSLYLCGWVFQDNPELSTTTMVEKGERYYESA